MTTSDPPRVINVNVFTEDGQPALLDQLNRMEQLLMTSAEVQAQTNARIQQINDSLTNIEGDIQRGIEDARRAAAYHAKQLEEVLADQDAKVAEAVRAAVADSQRDLNDQLGILASRTSDLANIVPEPATGQDGTGTPTPDELGQAPAPAEAEPATDSAVEQPQPQLSDADNVTESETGPAVSDNPAETPAPQPEQAAEPVVGQDVAPNGVSPIPSDADQAAPAPTPEPAPAPEQGQLAPEEVEVVSEPAPAPAPAPAPTDLSPEAAAQFTEPVDGRPAITGDDAINPQGFGPIR